MYKLATKTGIIALALLMTLVGSLPFSTAHAASATEINAGVQESMSLFRQKVKDPQEVLSKAKGLLVFPKVYQGGFIIGGEYGEGALLVGGKTVDYYNLVSASYGFQLGGQKKTVIIAFMTDQALAAFRHSKGWQIGADASVALIKVGAEGQLELTTLNDPVIGFVLDQKGLMYNLSLEGSKITKINK